jgi:hypothetical protein
LPGLLLTFFSQPAILGASTAILLVAASRLVDASPLSAAELALCLAAAALWCVCEWGIHRHLLHPSLPSGGKPLDPVRELLRRTHEQHHARPYLHVSVDGGPLIAAFMFGTGICWALGFWVVGGLVGSVAAGVGGGAAAVGGGISGILGEFFGGGGGEVASEAAAAAGSAAAAAAGAGVFGGSIGSGFGLSSPLFPSALATYWAFGLLYEFSHFAAHTRYVPKGSGWPARWLRSVRRHHLLHHCRSEEHWLSFTVPGVDALFGTLPAPRGSSKGGEWPDMTPMARSAARSWRAGGGGDGGA